MLKIPSFCSVVVLCVFGNVSFDARADILKKEERIFFSSIQRVDTQLPALFEATAGRAVCMGYQEKFLGHSANLLNLAVGLCARFDDATKSARKADLLQFEDHVRPGATAPLLAQFIYLNYRNGARTTRVGVFKYRIDYRVEPIELFTLCNNSEEGRREWPTIGWTYGWVCDLSFDSVSQRFSLNLK
jgi:hypothetical protein